MISPDIEVAQGATECKEFLGETRLQGQSGKASGPRQKWKRIHFPTIFPEVPLGCLLELGRIQHRLNTSWKGTGRKKIIRRLLDINCMKNRGNKLLEMSPQGWIFSLAVWMSISCTGPGFYLCFWLPHPVSCCHILRGSRWRLKELGPCYPNKRNGVGTQNCGFIPTQFHTLQTFSEWKVG